MIERKIPHFVFRPVGIWQSLLIICVWWAASGCNNTRFLPQDERLLVRNKIHLEQEGSKKDKRNIRDDLQEIPIPRSNTRFLGVFKTRLWFYNVATRRDKKLTKFRRWLIENVGEAPVLYTREKREHSEGLIRNYLSNKGYFTNEVVSRISEKKRRVRTHYHIRTKDYYTIKSIEYPVDLNNPIHRIIDENIRSAELRAGQPFDIADLKSERERITRDMRDEGYFFFTKDYVSFLLDSNKLDMGINVLISINQPSDSSRHEKYRLRDIYIYPDYSIKSLLEATDYDTLMAGDYHFIYNELKFKPRAIIDPIRFEKGDLYRQSDYSGTTQGLVRLGVFKFVNISYNVADADSHLLDAHIYLTPSKKQSISAELNANHNFTGFTGTALALTYRNKNLSGKADELTISTTTGVEFQFNRDLPLINTADVIADFSYAINRYLVPFKNLWLNKGLVPITRFGFRYNFEQRLNFYALHSLNLSVAYEWNTRRNRRHILSPILLNLVFIANESDQFKQRLADIPSLRNNFQEQLIPGASYQFIWQRPPTKKRKGSIYFRGSLETAGNLLHAFVSLGKINSATPTPYRIFNRTYSQYFKIDGDIRYYFPLNDKSTFVTRFFGGIGVPYGNVSFMPYVKQYFVGGTYSLRAFQIRSLGPGTYNDDEIRDQGFFEDQTGDIKLEANVEYRFEIFKFIKGGLFLDAGNVWLISEDPERPGGVFRWKDFHQGIALGGGAGIRLDFNYFIFRLDVAFPFRNPELPPGERWVIKDLQLSDRVFNLGVGYPF